jgi:hypothetical protein
MKTMKGPGIFLAQFRQRRLTRWTGWRVGRRKGL